MPDTNEILRRAKIKSAFLNAATKLPAYEDWTPEEIAQDVSGVLTANDPKLFEQFANHLSENSPEYEGWTPDEIRKDLATFFLPPPRSNQEKFQQAVDERLSQEIPKPPPEEPYQPKLLETVGEKIGGNAGRAVGAFLDVPFKTMQGSIHGGLEEFGKAGEAISRPGTPLETGANILESIMHAGVGVAQPAIGAVMASTAFVNPYSYLFQYVPEAVQRAAPEAAPYVQTATSPVESGYKALGLPEGGQPGAKIIDLLIQGAALSKFGVSKSESIGAESLGREKTLEDYQRELKDRQSESTQEPSHFDMTGEPLALLPENATPDYRYVNDPILGTRVEANTMSAKDAVAYAKEAKRVAEGQAQLTGLEISQQLSLDFPSEKTRFASDLPSSPVTERGTREYQQSPVIIGELQTPEERAAQVRTPEWVSSRYNSLVGEYTQGLRDVYESEGDPNAQRQADQIHNLASTDPKKFVDLAIQDKMQRADEFERDWAGADPNDQGTQMAQAHLRELRSEILELQDLQSGLGAKTATTVTPELIANERGQTVSEANAEQQRIGVVPGSQQSLFPNEGTNKPDIVIPSTVGGERIVGAEMEKAATDRIAERLQKKTNIGGEFDSTPDAVEAGRKATKEQALERANRYLAIEKNLRKQKDLANQLKDKEKRRAELRRIGLEQQKNAMDNREFAEGYVAEQRGTDHIPYPNDIAEQVAGADKAEAAPDVAPTGKAPKAPKAPRAVAPEIPLTETGRTKVAAYGLTKEQYDALAPDVRGAVARAFGFSGKNMDAAAKDRLWRQIEATRPREEVTGTETPPGTSEPSAPSAPKKVADLYPSFKPKKAVPQDVVPEGLRSRVKYQGKTSTGEHEFIIKDGEARGANIVLTDDAMGNIEENINRKLAEKEQVFSGTTARKLRDMGATEEGIEKFTEARAKATTPEEINKAFLDLARDQHKDNPAILKNKEILQSVADAMKETVEREVKPEDVPLAENAPKIDEIQSMLEQSGVPKGAINTFLRLVQRATTEEGLNKLLYDVAMNWYRTNKPKAYERMAKAANSIKSVAKAAKAHERGSQEAVNMIAAELRKNLAEFLPKDLKKNGFDPAAADWADILAEIKRRYKESGGLGSDELKGGLRSQFVPNVDPRKVAHILEPIVTKARDDAGKMLDAGQIAAGDFNMTVQKFIADGVEAAFARSGLNSGHIDQLKIAAANLSKYAGNVRLDRFSPEGQQVISEAVAKDAAAEAARQKRYSRTHAQTEAAAVFEGDVVDAARKGTVDPRQAFNAEQLEAMDSEFDRVSRLDPVELKKEDPDEIANLLETMKNARSIAGQALEILGKDVDPQVAEQMLLIAKQAKDPKTRAAIEEGVRRLRAREPIPPGLWDKIAEWGRNLKLLAISPVAKSVVGNGTMQILKYPELIGEITSKKIRSAIAGVPSGRSYHEVAADWIGFRSGIGEGADIAWKMIKEDHDALEQSAFLKQETGSTGGAIGGNLGVAVRTPQRIHGALDALYRIPTARGLIGREAVKAALAEGKDGQNMIDRANELMAAPTPEMVARAGTDARYYTFQNELGKIGKELNRLRLSHPIFQIPIPFFNTPVNLFKTMVEHSPFAPLTPTFQQALIEALSKPSNEPKSSVIHGYERITGKKFEPASNDIDVKLSRLVTGTTATIAMGMMIGKMLNGTITGRAPKNKLDREALERNNWQEYSVKIGDKYVSYKGFEPVSGWLGVLSDFLNGDKDETTNERVFSSTINLVKNFAENPFLVGTKSMSDAISDPSTTSAEKFVAGTIAGMLMPTLVQQTTAVMDPVRRRVDTFGEMIQRKTPGMSQELLPQRNVFGEPITEENAEARIVGTRVSTAKNDPVEKELERLGMKLGWADDTFEGIKLTPEKHDKLLEIAGKTYKKGLDRLVVSPAYAAMTDGMKMTTIRSMQSFVRDGVRTSILGDEILQGFMKKLEVNLTGGIVPPEKKDAIMNALRGTIKSQPQQPPPQAPATEPAPAPVEEPAAVNE